MPKAFVRAISLAFMIAALQLWAAEPLVGRWLLQSQEVGGQKTEQDPLTLRIIQKGNAYEFAYSVPVNNIQFVSMSFSPRLDGAESDVKDSQGNKIGTVKVTKSGAALYKVILQGPNRPTAVGTMAVSSDGKTLTCESDANIRGQSVHTRQIFSRQ